MNRVEALCAMNRFMMEAFSERTVQGLAQHTLFRLALPPFQSFLDINVSKEVEKDRRVIMRAGQLHESGTRPEAGHVSTLLREAREVDEAFVRKAAVFPININIQYHDIEHYRQQRIDLMLNTSHHILGLWQQAGSFRSAVGELYDEAGFQELLHNILRLYAMETRSLSRSIRLPGLLTMARDAVTQTITDVMKQEAKSLSQSLAIRIYRRR